MNDIFTADELNLLRSFKCGNFEIYPYLIDAPNKEITLIKLYQGTFFSCINAYLITKQHEVENEALEIICSLLNKSLDFLPSYDKKEVFRGENFLFDFNKVKLWFKRNEGKTFSYPSFLSTSKSNKFMSNYNLVIKISTSEKSRGYDLSLTNFQHVEEEVLFKSNTSFLIKSFDALTKILEVEEVNKVPDYILHYGEGFFISKRQKSNKNTALSLTDQGII